MTTDENPNLASTIEWKRTQRKLMELERDGAAVTDEDVDQYIEDCRNKSKSLNESLNTTTQTVLDDEEMSANRADVRQKITRNKLHIVDVEIEEVRSCIDDIAEVKDYSNRLQKVLYLRDWLYDIVDRLHQPEFANAINEERSRVCKLMHASLVDYELQLSREGTQVELNNLRAELKELENEQQATELVQTDRVGEIYDSIQQNIEIADQEMAATAESQKSCPPSLKAERTPTSPSSPKNVGGSRLALAGLQMAADTDSDAKVMNSAMSTFMTSAGMALSLVPGDTYKVGMEEGTPMIVYEKELKSRNHQSQWSHISQQKGSNYSAWNKTFGLMGSSHGDPPIVGYAPTQEVPFKSFYISTQPFRTSDWKRILEIPQYAERANEILSKEMLEAYQNNYVPEFVGGQQFGFQATPKDFIDDVDDPFLELPFYKAVEVAELLGARLPTWQEWEAAMRGPDSNLYPWGNEIQLDALELDDPVEWDMDVRTVNTEVSLVHDPSISTRCKGFATRVTRWGVYKHERSYFGLKSMTHFGFEWNTANYDLGEKGPTTHLLRTMGDYYTQTIFAGGDVTGNHRSFSGPVLPLYAHPNKFTRNATFRLVFALPDDVKVAPTIPDFNTPLAASTDVRQTKAVKAFQESLKIPKTSGSGSEPNPELLAAQKDMVVRASGFGGGVMRGSPGRLGFAMGGKLTVEDIAFSKLLLLVGRGHDQVLQTLGEPETITPHLFECGYFWDYYSLGIQLMVEGTFHRQVVKEIILWDSSATDLVTKEWNRYPGAIDLEGLKMKGLTSAEIAESPGWGKPHNKRSSVSFYLRNYVDLLPVDPDPESLTFSCRRHNASSSIAFEFTTRHDASILKIRTKVGS